MKSTTIFAAAMTLASTSYAATSTAIAVEEPSGAPTLGTQVSQGCFSSAGTLVLNSTIKFNSKGSCATEVCYAGGALVAATSGGNMCYCGSEYPPKSTLVDDSNCNTPCPGYDLEACGGIGFFTVYNTGIMLSVESSEDTSSSATATATAVQTAATTIVSGDQTSVIFVTATPTGTTSSNKSSSSSGSTVGIIAGVVVAVVALLAVGGGVFFWMRRKRNREIEEEHRRNAAVNAFMGGKPPGSSSGYSIDTDARLDPVMAQRRLSTGSIADNEDYSRRILRVTNA